MASFVDDWQSRRTIIQSNRYMLIKELACDVTFLVGKLSVEISAHKFILVSRSCVFYAMLCGPLAEKPNHCIRTPDIEPATFKLMLQWVFFFFVIIGCTFCLWKQYVMHEQIRKYCTENPLTIGLLFTYFFVFVNLFSILFPMIQNCALPRIDSYWLEICLCDDLVNDF